MISSSFSLSINIKSRVPVLLLVILNGASKSYKISWLYQNLSSRVLNEFRDFAVTTVSGRLLADVVSYNFFTSYNYGNFSEDKLRRPRGKEFDSSRHGETRYNAKYVCLI